MKRLTALFRGERHADSPCAHCGNKNYVCDGQGVVRCDKCACPAESATQRMEAKA